MVLGEGQKPTGEEVSFSLLLLASGKVPYWSFGDTIPVPTVARVHFLSSKLCGTLNGQNT